LCGIENDWAESGPALLHGTARNSCWMRKTTKYLCMLRAGFLSVPQTRRHGTAMVTCSVHDPLQPTHRVTALLQPQAWARWRVDLSQKAARGEHVPLGSLLIYRDVFRRLKDYVCVAKTTRTLPGSTPRKTIQPKSLYEG
jgi:hypothetical protein